MDSFPAASVDMILCDLPYGTTRNAWDSVIPFQPLWQAYERIIKPNGAIVLTATQPFSSHLVVSNPDLFRYEWIWEKTISSGQLNVNIQPLRSHESVLIFYKNQPTYNQQLDPGKPYSIRRERPPKKQGYNDQRSSAKENTGFRHPRSILCIPNPRQDGGHPTQKPTELFKYLIRTYTNPGELVLDNCIGSGTTAVAALESGRDFIGIEIESEYVAMSRSRISEAQNNGLQELF